MLACLLAGLLGGLLAGLLLAGLLAGLLAAFKSATPPILLLEDEGQANLEAGVPRAANPWAKA